MNSKRVPLVPVLLGAVVLITGSLVVAISNHAIPGDAFYTLDRSTETITLSLRKITSKFSYGRYNLVLATERLSEIRALKQVLPVTYLETVTVYAQSEESGMLDKYLARLVFDINHNLTEAQDILTQLPQSEQQLLSLEIAQNTTIYGQDLLEITKDLTEDTVKTFTDVIKNLEAIDASAIDFLASSEDMTPDKKTEEDRKVGETLDDKLETKLLKLREQQRIYARLLTSNADKLPTDTARATLLLEEITTELLTAETQLSTQAYKAVADILDKTADKLDLVRDLLEIASFKPEKIETPDKKETEGDNIPTPTISKTSTIIPRPTKTIAPSVPPGSTAKPVSSEELEEKDVEGIKTPTMTFFDLLRNRLRF